MMATDPLSLLFMGSFLIGLFFLLITLLLGNMGHSHGGAIGHHSAPVHVPAATHHAGLSHTAHSTAHTTTSQAANQERATNASFSLLTFINPMNIVLFLVGFGLFGYILHNATTIELPLILVLSAICGLIVAVIFLFLLSRIFRDSEGATVQDVSDRTGLLGKVSITVPEKGLGEILYISPGGMRKSVPARSVDGRRLEREQEVVVVTYQNGVAEVDTWEHFINQEDDEPLVVSHADELATLRALLEDTTTQNTPSRPEYNLLNDSQKE